MPRAVLSRTEEPQVARKERPAAVAPSALPTVPPAPKRVLLVETPPSETAPSETAPSETAPQAAREPDWPTLPEVSGARSVPQFGLGPRRSSLGPAASPQHWAIEVATADDDAHRESRGPWPELPDDNDTRALPRSVFSDAWVRGLDDEQRCV